MKKISFQLEKKVRENKWKLFEKQLKQGNKAYAFGWKDVAGLSEVNKRRFIAVVMEMDQKNSKISSEILDEIKNVREELIETRWEIEDMQETVNAEEKRLTLHAKAGREAA